MADLSIFGVHCTRAATLGTLCLAIGAMDWVVATVCMHVKFIAAVEWASVRRAAPVVRA